MCRGFPWQSVERTVLVMCTPREDAAGADVGDGSVPVAPAIEARPCEHGPAGSVDLIRHDIHETWHFQPAAWVEFLAAVKAGKFDGAAGGMMPG
jgi:hypothetical protein